MVSNGIYDLFLNSVSRDSGAIALEIGDDCLSFGQIHSRVSRLSGAIFGAGLIQSPFIGILGHKSQTSAISMLTALHLAKGYMPLHPLFPVDRLAYILQKSGIDTVIVGSEGRDAMIGLLQQEVGRKIRWVIPDDTYLAEEILARYKSAIVLTPAACKSFQGEFAPLETNGQQPAYLLFTSGSTGYPKGVAVSHQNAIDYLRFARQTWQIGPGDRCSQTFDLTFDLSVHDHFATWGGGGTLCVLSAGDLLFPANFIRSKSLTHWFSVPAVAMLMSKMKQLVPDSFPSLREVLFCGEALPVPCAAQWRRAAPSSRISNLYGPTEATIAITHFTYDASADATSFPNDIVPIGRAFPGQLTEIYDSEKDSFCEGAGVGELWLSGSQVTSGYLKDEERTSLAFVHREGRYWYRTGDLVSRDKDNNLHFVGRIDFQLKINGYRVEAGEIEAVLRRVFRLDMVVVVPWPDAKRPEKLIAVYSGSFFGDLENSRAELEKFLPHYMIPADILSIDVMPLNSNGKIDRKALLSWIETLR